MRQNRPLLLGFGALIVVVGVIWTLQGLDVLGQSGGMNGQRIWAVIGVILVAAGVALLATGARAGRRP